MGFLAYARSGLSGLLGTLFTLSIPATVLAQSAALVPNAVQQYFNANGQPLAGGSVYYYVPSTTTSKTVWVDPFENTPASQPVLLNSGGFPIGPSTPNGIFGQGNYQQLVYDANGNLIWDGFTSAYGSSSPSGSSGTDTAPVGTVLPWAGSNLNIPTNWQLAYGQAVSRSTFSQLLTAITIQTTTGNCIATSFSITGFSSTAQIPVGSPIESTCLPTGTTVSSIVNASTVTVSQAATATGTFTVTDFPWGNGDGATTFNVPDLRGRTFAGADCMGGSTQTANCASRLTATYYGSNAYAPGVAGGLQSSITSTTIAQTNLPSVNFAVTIPANQGSHTHAEAGNGDFLAVSGTSPSQFLTVSSGSIVVRGTTQTAAAGLPAMAGTAASGGSATPANTASFSVVQPTLTVNYIIKVAPNSSGAGGVVSIGGMFGDILCGVGLTCANQTISASGGASSIIVNSSTVSSGTSGYVLYDNSGILGNLSPSITVNGTTCTLAGSCTISASSSLLVGVTTFTSGTSGYLAYDNGGVLGMLAPNTTINSTVCAVGGSCTITVNSIVVGTTAVTGGNSNGMLYTNSSGLLASVSPITSGVYVTNGSGVPLTVTTLPSGLTAPSLTVTGLFTATSLVTNNDLVSSSTTVNGQTCTLGATCTVAAAAGTLTGSTLASGVTTSSLVSFLSAITSGTWQGTPIALAFGGTNANLTASAGGIVYSTASALGILAGTATAAQCLLSGSNAPPTWGSCSGAAAVSSVAPATSAVTVSPQTGAVVVGLNLANANTWTAVQTHNNNDLALLGSSSGSTTFSSANASATNYTLTIPANTGTLAETNLSQTFSANQTFSASLTFSGLSSGTCTNGLAINSGNSVITSACPTTITPQVITATGTYTPTSGMRYTEVICTGAGGTGGSGQTTTINSGGGGGGAGETVSGTFTSAQVGASLHVTIGAAGANTCFGDTSACGGSPLLIAAFGSNGGNATTSTGGTGGLGGSGGTPQSGNPDLIGGDGSPGQFGTTGVAVGAGGQGAASYWGGGGRGGVNANGSAGRAYGAGGGGGSQSSTGGAGAGGVCVFKDFT